MIGAPGTGWYVARWRAASADDRTVVRVNKDNDGSLTCVWQLGRRDPTPLSDWELIARVRVGGQTESTGLDSFTIFDTAEFADRFGHIRIQIHPDDGLWFWCGGQIRWKSSAPAPDMNDQLAAAYAAGLQKGRDEVLECDRRENESRNIARIEAGRHYAFIDLMTDALRFGADAPITRMVTIVVADGFRVVEDGRIAEALGFDEMLGQVVTLLHPEIAKPRYAMCSRADLFREAESSRARREQNGASA